jgi:hypothetical protein
LDIYRKVSENQSMEALFGFYRKLGFVVALVALSAVAAPEPKVPRF